jgi:hypothetical protein
MRTASGLMLVAFGAILAFAIKGHPSWLNIQVVGWVLMLTGVVGMALPRRGYGWLRRRMVLRRGPGGRPVVNRAEDKRYPPYVMLNPGAAVTPDDMPEVGERVVGEPPTVMDPPEAGFTAEPPDAGMAEPSDWEAAERAVAEWEAAEESAAPGDPRPAEEVVEEYIEE